MWVHLKLITIIYIKIYKINFKVIVILILNKNNEYIFNLIKNIVHTNIKNNFNLNKYKF